MEWLAGKGSLGCLALGQTSQTLSFITVEGKLAPGTNLILLHDI